MSGAPVLPDALRRRLDQLSPERRALLERQLAQASGPVPDATISRRATDGPAPLSSGQEFLWRLDQAIPDLVAYNVPRLLRIAGDLDVPALRRALDWIVARHEILRTHFLDTPAGSRQVVDAARPVPFELLAIDTMSAGADAAIATLVRDRARYRFDLTRDVQLRATLIRTSANAHLLLLLSHHIVCDETSRDIIFRELGVAYNAFRSGGEPVLPELPIQYADYATWQRDAVARGALASQLAYWREQLAGLPALQLPTDRPQGSIPGFAGARCRHRVPAALRDAVQLLAQEHDVTLFSMLLAAYQVLLSRYSGQVDFAVGVPATARRQVELERTVGYFPGLLVLRASLDGDPTFVQLLARVRERTLTAFEHQDVSLEELETGRGATSNASLYQVFFSLQGSAPAPVQLDGATVALQPTDLRTAKLDLALGCADLPDGLHTVMEFRTGLFDAATVDRMLLQFESLLQSIVQMPDARISDLTILPADECVTVIERWNATAVPVPVDRCTHELVADQARRTPDAAAVVHGASTLTYAELDARADTVARRLGALGVGPGVLVGVCLPRALELPVAVLGVLKAGGAYLPLDPEYPAERLAFIAADSGVSLIVTMPAVEEAIRATPARRLWIAVGESGVDLREADSGLAIAPADLDAPRAARAHDLAYVIYTSGSTGRPKGVEVEHRNIVNFLTGLQRSVPMARGDVMVAVTPLSFDISALELFHPLVSGARVVLASRDEAADARMLEQLLTSSQATHLQATPSTWRMLVEAGWPGRTGMVALCGGEALPQTLADALVSRGLVLWNLYGPTEATIWATMHQQARIGQPVRIGRPMPNVRAYVLDAARRPMPIGVPGELWLGGSGIARGYRDRAELTAERFVANPFVPGDRMYRTGDLARWHPDGTLEYLGRTDHQVKLRGHRIELGEVETAILLEPGVSGAVAMVRADSHGDAQLVAYVVAAGDPAPPAAVIRDGLRQRLPAIMVPGAIVFLDAFPMTPNGKIDRNALPAPDGAMRVKADYATPRTAVEREVTAIWAEVFALERVGIRDDFFDLGGHSLLAMRMIGMMQRRLALGAPVTIRMVLEDRTPERLAARIALMTPPTASLAGMAPIARRPTDDPAPLSPAQHLVWLYEQMAPGLPTYNVPWAFRVRGAYDVVALQVAVDGLLKRHDALRTIFVEIDGEPRQMIGPAAPAALKIVDLRNTGSAGSHEAEGLRLLQAEAVTPFDLATGPVFRATLVQLTDTDAFLSFVAHHAVCDGAAVGVITRDLGALYDAARERRPPALDPLPIRFADFAAWGHANQEAQRVEEGLSYWRGELDGAPNIVALTTDQPRMAGGRPEGARYTTTFPPAIADAVWRVAREHDATPFMVLLAAFHSLLHRYTGETDIVIGSPVAGRGRPETVGVVGNFANALALRARFDDDPSFQVLIDRVRDAALGAMDHQDVSQEALVLERHRDRPLAQAGLFSVLFVLQEPAADHLRLGGARLEAVPIDIGASKFDLSLSMAEIADGFRVSMQYRADLFDATTIRQLVAHFQLLIDGLTQSPDLPISRVPLLTSGERHRVLQEWNDTDAAYPAGETLLDLLEAQAARTPDMIAVIDGTRSLTFAALHERAGAVGRWLQAQGAGPGELVGVCVERSLDLVVALVGVLKCGAAYVPVDPEYPADRVAFMLDDAAVRVLITQRPLLAALPSRTCVTLALDVEWPPVAAAAATTVRRAGPDDPAYMIYTSGSTGRPKGAINSHRGIVNRLRWMQGEYRLTAEDAVLQKTPASFDVSVWELFLPLMTGARLVMAEPGGHRDAGYLAEVISRHRITILHFVPSMLAGFLDLPAVAGACRSVRDLVCSGEALPTALARRFLAALPHARLHNLYGPTEAAVDVAFFACSTAPARDTVPIGRPVANTQLYVLDRHREPVPIGVPGELYIGGVQVGVGYHRRPELTAERFVVDPFGAGDGARLYRTGDRVRWLKDGTLEFLGRLDHQVKLRGQRIELGEIEARLLEQPGVAAAAVIVREDVADDARLAAYVVGGNPAPAAGQLLAVLRRTLPSYMVPGALVMLPALPVTPSGKLDRDALPRPPQFREADDAIMVAPRTPVEEVIASIWSEVLRTGPVSVTGSFFELGGHSLLATQVVSRLVKLFRTPLPLRRFFEHPTVAGLARELIATELRPGQTDAIARAMLKLRDMSPAERLARHVDGIAPATPRSA